MLRCNECQEELVPDQNVDGVCYDCWDKLVPAQPESTHKPICHEYWDRGLNCPCIPQAEQDRIKAAIKRGDSVDDIIDPGWGPN